MRPPANARNRSTSRPRSRCFSKEDSPRRSRYSARARRILRTALNLALGVAYYGLRRFDDAAGAFLRTIAIAPGTDQPVAASNRRYLAFVMQLEDPRASLEKLDRVTRKESENGRTYRGFNFFDEQDREVLEAIGQGEFCITGMQNKTLRKMLPGRSTQQVSRTIKRLRTHGLVKKTARSYKYYLTPLGREVVASGLRLKQFVILEELRKDPAA